MKRKRYGWVTVQTLVSKIPSLKVMLIFYVGIYGIAFVKKDRK
jgi:hypothetical protein